MNAKPKQIVVEYEPAIPSGIVLDLGCGTGDNAIFIAGQGRTVEAVDNSAKAIRELEDKAGPVWGRIAVIKQNVEDFRFSMSYAAIISTCVLHFLEKTQIAELVDNMKRHTLQKGLNIVSVFTKNGELSGLTFFENNELRKMYADWDILHYSEKPNRCREKREDGTPKIHEVATIVARSK